MESCIIMYLPIMQIVEQNGISEKWNDKEFLKEYLYNLRNCVFDTHVRGIVPVHRKSAGSTSHLNVSQQRTLAVSLFNSLFRLHCGVYTSYTVLLVCTGLPDSVLQESPSDVGKGPQPESHNYVSIVSCIVGILTDIIMIEIIQYINWFPTLTFISVSRKKTLWLDDVT